MDQNTLIDRLSRTQRDWYESQRRSNQHCDEFFLVEHEGLFYALCSYHDDKPKYKNRRYFMQRCENWGAWVETNGYPHWYNPTPVMLIEDGFSLEEIERAEKIMGEL